MAFVWKHDSKVSLGPVFALLFFFCLSAGEIRLNLRFMGWLEWEINELRCGLLNPLS